MSVMVGSQGCSALKAAFRQPLPVGCLTSMDEAAILWMRKNLISSDLSLLCVRGAGARGAGRGLPWGFRRAWPSPAAAMAAPGESLGKEG